MRAGMAGGRLACRVCGVLLLSAIVGVVNAGDMDGGYVMADNVLYLARRVINNRNTWWDPYLLNFGAGNLCSQNGHSDKLFVDTFCVCEAGQYKIRGATANADKVYVYFDSYWDDYHTIKIPVSPRSPYDVTRGWQCVQCDTGYFMPGSTDAYPGRCFVFGL